MFIYRISRDKKSLVRQNITVDLCVSKNQVLLLSLYTVCP